MGRPRKGKGDPQEGTEPQAGLPPEGAELEKSTTEAETASTVTIRFDPSGKPRPLQRQTLERLRAALPQLGINEEFVGSDIPHRLIAEKIFDGLCSGIPWVQSWLMESFIGLPAVKTREILRYTKEEKAEMREPSIALLSEYLGDLWRGDPNIYTLLIVLIAVHFGKTARLAEKLKQTEGSAGPDGSGNGGAP